MKALIIAGLALFSSLAFAADLTETFDCTHGCRLVTDPFAVAPAPQPTSCKLYRYGVVVLTTPVVDANANGIKYYDGRPAPAGSVACQFRVTLYAGTWVQDAVAVYPTEDSPHSDLLTLISKVTSTLTAPTGLRAEQ